MLNVIRHPALFGPIRRLTAHAIIDVRYFPVFVRASTVISSVMLICWFFTFLTTVFIL